MKVCIKKAASGEFPLSMNNLVPCTLNVVIAYDELAAGKRAMRALCGPAFQLQGAIRFHPNLWRFDFLEDPVWRALAASDVIQADVVILSRNDQTFPEWFKAWLCACLSQRSERPGAVVALLEHGIVWETPAVEPLLWLQAAAREAGMDFFSSPCQSHHLPEENFHEAARVPTTKAASLDGNDRSYEFEPSAENPQPTAWESLSPEAGYRHWGIND